MNKDGCEAVLSYLIQQLNIITQDMKISEESKKILASSLKQFYFSEILFSDAKNTILSQDPMKLNLSASSQSDCSQFQSSILPFSHISHMPILNQSNNSVNYIQKPFNSSNLMFSNHPPIVSSSLTNIVNQQTNTSYNAQTNDNSSSIGTQDLLKLLNRVSLLKMIDDTPIPARTKPNDFSKKTRPWSVKEDNRLLGAIMRFGLDNWSRISKFVGNNRTRGQCSQRWSRGLNPNISRVEWSPQEDSNLLNYVKIHGNKKWSKISSLIGNRSDVQCRYRYKQLIKKRTRNEFDLTVNVDDHHDITDNDAIENYKESNSNTNETEESFSNTDDSNIEDKAGLRQIKNEEDIDQNHELNYRNPIQNTYMNPQNIFNTNQIIQLPNKAHVNFLMNNDSIQNFKTEKKEFPLPSSCFHKGIPSLDEGFDIDTFLSKFKE